jgi:hypothetical protein
MTAIFISHNSNDAREAVALKRWLADNGWDDVFLDIDVKHGLSPGERWKDALKNAAEHCEAVLCLVSPTWLASAECKLEYRYAETLRKHLFLAIVKPCNAGSAARQAMVSAVRRRCPDDYPLRLPRTAR